MGTDGDIHVGSLVDEFNEMLEAREAASARAGQALRHTILSALGLALDDGKDQSQEPEHCDEKGSNCERAEVIREGDGITFVERWISQSAHGRGCVFVLGLFEQLLFPV